MEQTTQRNFILGDHWLYFKIYTGYKTSDKILTEVIKPVATSLQKANVISQWFYIRYSDPQHHIRVRFYLPDPAKIGLVIQQLRPYFQHFMNEDLIWKVQTDTYEREIERYGVNTIALAENLFFHESNMLVQMLEYIQGLKDEELRWLFALRATDHLLDSFQYDLEQKFEIIKTLAYGFGQEFGMNKSLKVQLDKKYRNQRKKIEEFIQFTPEQKPDFEFVVALLNQLYHNSKETIEAILIHRQENSLTIDLDDLLRSFIHMLLNRLFKSKNRLNEMVCYNLLERYYKSTLGRQKKQQQKQQEQREGKQEIAVS